MPRHRAAAIPWRAAPRGCGPARLEVDDVEIILHHQDLSQMQIAMDARLHGRDRPFGQRLEGLEAVGAPRQEIPEDRDLGLAHRLLCRLQGIEGRLGIPRKRWRQAPDPSRQIPPLEGGILRIDGKGLMHLGDAPGQDAHLLGVDGVALCRRGAPAPDRPRGRVETRSR